MNPQSALFTGKVMHQRLRPMKHRLEYRVFSLLIDLDELAALDQRLRLFSLNRFNLFSLHEADYGAGGNGGLRTYIDQQLQSAGLVPAGLCALLTMPRILGYAFNPLTVYFCHRDNGDLQAVVYEVNNTFGERHSYLIEVPAAEAQAPRLQQGCAKQFHVSPFLDLAMQYVFDVTPPAPERPRLVLGVDAHDQGGAVLVARLKAQRRTLSDGTLARAFVTHPLLTLKVVGAIHWEALKLWLKGARLHRKPAPPAQPLSTVPRKEL